MRLFAAILILCAFTSTAQQHHVTDAEVREVHRSALLIDSHNDAPSKTLTGVDMAVRGTKTHTDIPRLREGGVGAVFFAAYVAPAYAKDHTSANRALQMIDAVRHDIVAAHSDDFALALTADDILAAHKAGKVAALIGIEGGHAIEDSPRLLRDFYALGVRYMTLTHTNTNTWADSSGDPRDTTVQHHNGLTDLGRQIVREMNRVGMIVDISHVADKTFWDALETSKVPIFASHSSCRALCNVPRNMTDEMIAALGKKGGVIQINFNCGFLRQRSADEEKQAEAKGRSETRLRNRATLADVVDHIDHAVKIAGIDAVGIGSDFDGITCTPQGLDDVSKFPNLTRALLEKGYSAANIRKLYGENLLRVMRAVEAGRAR